KFPHLMTQGCGILSHEFPATPTTERRLQANDVGTQFRGKERTLMSGMPHLTAGFAFGMGFGAWWLGVRMFDTAGQSGVARPLIQPVFQFLNPRQQQANDGLCFRSLPGNQFVRDLQCHAGDCAENRVVGQSDSPKSLPRVVAGYFGEVEEDTNRTLPS